MKSDEILIKTFDQVKNDNFDQVKFDQVIVCQIRVLYFVLAFLKLIQEKGAHSTLVLRKTQFSDSFG